MNRTRLGGWSFVGVSAVLASILSATSAMAAEPGAAAAPPVIPAAPAAITESITTWDHDNAAATTDRSPVTRCADRPSTTHR